MIRTLNSATLLRFVPCVFADLRCCESAIFSLIKRDIVEHAHLNDAIIFVQGIASLGGTGTIVWARHDDVFDMGVL